MDYIIVSLWTSRIMSEAFIRNTDNKIISVIHEHDKTGN